MSGRLMNLYASLVREGADPDFALTYAQTALRVMDEENARSEFAADVWADIVSLPVCE